MEGMKRKVIARDISWLSFNARVLQEAADPTVPLRERMRFLGIFSNNMDEFFRVRVATLARMVRLGKACISSTNPEILAPRSKPRSNGHRHSGSAVQSGQHT